MCIGEPASPTFATARTDEHYVLAVAVATRRGEIAWRPAQGPAWFGDVSVGAHAEHRVELRRGLLQTLDGRGRKLRAVLAPEHDASLLLALTRLLVAIRSAKMDVARAV